MGRTVDDAFKAAEDQASRNKREQKRRAREKEFYDQHAGPIARSFLEAIRVKAEEFNAHPKNTNKAAVMLAEASITIRRASATGMPDRRIKVEFLKDYVEITWIYDSSPNPVYSEYQVIDAGKVGFQVVGEKVKVAGVDSPADFADLVLDQFIQDCANDIAKSDSARSN
jgi:hypothetical protein